MMKTPATMHYSSASTCDRDATLIDIYTRARINRAGNFSADRTNLIVLNYHGYTENRGGLYVERKVVSYMPMFPELPGRGIIGETAPLTSLVRSVVDLDQEELFTRDMTPESVWSPVEVTRNRVVRFKTQYDSELPERLVLQIDKVCR